jgi:hypothetical protein
MNSTQLFFLLAPLTLLGACASQEGFTSSWKAPDAEPLQLRGAKVAAVVMVQDDDLRRRGEDALAAEITSRGAIGIPMYTLLDGGAPSNEAAARAACEKAGVAGVIVMKTTSVDRKVEEKPVTYLEPMYRNYWDGYFDYGWGTSYEPVQAGTTFDIQTTVSVETRVYSLRQNKLVWSGQGKTTNPKSIEAEVKKLSAATAATLEREGLLR